MKKFLSLCGISMILCNMLSAQNGYDEIGYMTFKYGLTNISDEFSLDKHTFALDFIGEIGLEVKPKLDLTYVHVKESGGVDYLLQGALGAFRKFNTDFYDIAPYVSGGVGYEYVNNARSDFDSNFYLQGAVGIEIPVSDPSYDVHVILETRFMQFMGAGEGQDNEATLFFGLRLPIGNTFSYYSEPMARPTAQRYDAEERNTFVSPKAQPQVDAMPEITKETPAPKPGGNFPDADGDGVKDAVDVCPNTPPYIPVNGAGCPLKSGKTYVEPKKIVPQVAAPVSEGENKFAYSQGDVAPQSRKILNIHFKYNSDEVHEDSKGTVRTFVEAANRTRYSKVVVEGYTDDTGAYEKNIELSQRRAESVKNLMVSYGIDASRIRAVGKGPVSPIANNDTEHGRAQNRRIEIVLE